MANPFLINKSYRIRHKILKVLYEDWELHDRAKDRLVGSVKIASQTNIPIAEIHKFQYLLVEKGDVIISDNDGQSMISIQDNGISAYVDKRYIKEGRKSKWDGIFDWARIIIPLGALILSIVNYMNNRSLDNRIKDIQAEINNIKK